MSFREGDSTCHECHNTRFDLHNQAVALADTVFSVLLIQPCQKASQEIFWLNWLRQGCTS